MIARASAHLVESGIKNIVVYSMDETSIMAVEEGTLRRVKMPRSDEKYLLSLDDDPKTLRSIRIRMDKKRALFNRLKVRYAEDTVKKILKELRA